MLQSSQNNNFHFSHQFFTTLTKLLFLSQLPPSQQLLTQIKQTQPNHNISKYQSLLFNFIKHTALNTLNNKQEQTNNTDYTQALKAFLNIFSQTKTKIYQIEHIIANHKHIKLLICDKKRLYSLKQEINKKSHKKHKTTDYDSKTTPIMENINRLKPNEQQKIFKAYVIYGKAITVQRNKKSNPSTINQTQTTKYLTSQELSQKQHIISNLHYCMSLMYQQQKLPFSKCEPNNLDDLLLTYYLEDSSLLPLIVTNEVYKHFIPLDLALVLVVPEQPSESNKQQIPFIFKDTLLHIYMDNFRILSKTISRETFFKNTLFKGVFFVQQGQVQTKSGRIVARGWVISGKCKSTTHAWKFNKIITFFKYILHNQNVYKQFINDLKLNNQWPINVSHVLNLDDKVFEQLTGSEANSFKIGPNSQRNKKLKFPPISGRLNKTFDVSKLAEIYKMKHYDEKIHHLHQFKQEVLKKKIELGAKKGSLNRQGHSVSEIESKQVSKRIQMLSQKMNLPQKSIKTDVSRSLYLSSGESSANILITGIVKKLKSIHETPVRDSLDDSPRQNNKRKSLEQNRSRTKILGLKRYEQMMRYEKSRLYKGKNYYN